MESKTFKEWATEYLNSKDKQITKSNIKNLRNRIKERIYLLLFATPGVWKSEDNHYYYEALEYDIFYFLREFERVSAVNPQDTPTNIEEKTELEASAENINELIGNLNSLYKRYQERKGNIRSNFSYLQNEIQNFQFDEAEYKDIQEQNKVLLKNQNRNINEMLNIYDKINGISKDHLPYFDTVSNSESDLFYFLLSNIQKNDIPFLAKGEWWILSPSIRHECLKKLLSFEDNSWLGNITNSKIELLNLKLFQPHIYLYLYYQSKIIEELPLINNPGFFDLFDNILDSIHFPITSDESDTINDDIIMSLENNIKTAQILTNELSKENKRFDKTKQQPTTKDELIVEDIEKYIRTYDYKKTRKEIKQKLEKNP